MSQTAVGHELGVTFQQVQKYEKGTNRVSGSRLVTLAEVLKCSVEDLIGSESASVFEDGLYDAMLAIMRSKDGSTLAKAFLRINAKERSAVAKLVEAIADRNFS